MTLSLRVALVLGVGISTGVAAQQPRPTVAPFPLEIVRSGTPEMKKADKDLMVIEFRRLLLRSGADAPDLATMRTALQELKRQDCARNDECLKELAQKAKALYAVYAEADLDLSNQVVITGRIVRDDGVKAREPVVLKLPRGTEPFKDVAKVGITRLFEQLQLSMLPAAKPVEVKEPEVKTPEVKAVDPVAGTGTGIPNIVAPPMPPPEAKSQALPIGLMVGGGAVAVLGAVLWGSGAADAGNLKVDPATGFVGAVPTAENTESKLASTASGSERKQIIGGVLLGAGIAAGVTGLVLLLTSQSAEDAALNKSKMSFGFAPTANGAAAFVGGTF